MKLASSILLCCTLLLGALQFACSHTQAENSPPSNEKTAFFQARANDYLIKNEVLRPQLEITENGVRMYADVEARDSAKPEIKVLWEEAEVFVRMVKGLEVAEALEMYMGKGEQPFSAQAEQRIPPAVTTPAAATAGQPLKGWRIALDPGHVGGTMDFAFLEKKFVRIPKGDRPEVKEDIAFNEGNLALGTALLLRDTLQKMGAEVLLTREREGETAFGGKFADWLRGEYESAAEDGTVDWTEFRGRSPEGYLIKHLRAAGWRYVMENDIHGADSTWWLSKPTTRDMYRIPFLKAEFKERARKINAFRPHLTLIIHYNIWEKNTWDKGQTLHAIDDNYSMAFIPGSFMKGELRKPEDRMAFLSKLLSDDLPASERLSAAVVEGYEEHLKVPGMEWDDSLKYLRNASLRTPSKGVFARNLSLTRMVHGPMCFGEALYQDNVAECVALNRKDFLLEGMRTYMPNRIRDAVDAYVAGVLKYAEGE